MRSLGAAQTAPGFFFCFRRAVDREPRGTWGIVEEAGRPPPTFAPRARPVTQGAAILDCALAFLGPRWFPGTTSPQTRRSKGSLLDADRGSQSNAD
jgi:hypothetical protein